MLKKTTKTAAIASALAAAGVLALAAPAAAETAPQAAAAVPGCVTTALYDDGGTDELTVRNTCSYSVRVKVILAFKPDLACVTYPAKSYKDWTWSYPGRFDRLASC
ncbi:hypothetical protein [Nocardiopsis trehalosi]|uniref:hypothetical protein n=1 Tax=Nocardiopsis trehalosi TaxID=109329 RepID=UPI00082996A6|nr:hypothetical protein [Nocardiopsis trehalosi]